MDSDIFSRSRNHPQYTDIENFKKYEFRNCIAYELAIRSPKVIDLIKECSKYPPFSKEHNEIRGYLSEEYRIETHDIYLDYHFFNDINKDSFTLLDNKSAEGFIEDIPQKPNEERTYYTKSTELYVSSTSHSKKITEDGFIESANILITPVYARPYLFRSFDVAPNIRLDLSLPIQELIDFITRLKNEHTHNDKVFKSISELFNDLSINKQKLTYKNKKIADMLFTYDYVTHIKNKAIEDNRILEENLSDDNLDKYDREMMLKDVSIFTSGGTIINSEEYGDILLDQLKSNSKGTIGNYYNIINSLIENQSYKNLI